MPEPAPTAETRVECPICHEPMRVVEREGHPMSGLPACRTHGWIEPTTDAGLRLTEDGQERVIGALEALKAVVNRWVFGTPVQPDDVITICQAYALLSRALVDRDGMSVDDAINVMSAPNYDEREWGPAVEVLRAVRGTEE